MNSNDRMAEWMRAQGMWSKAMGLIGASLLVAGGAAADPVPVKSILTTPGFTSGLIESNGQALAYIQMADGFYAPVGATCTACPNGTITRAVNEPAPASTTEALSGLKFTQAVLNMGSGGAHFDLGVTITDDSIGILLGELGIVPQSGDPVTVYPTTNGVRVGSWSLSLVAADYGDTGHLWQTTYSGYAMKSFLTVFRLSDFENDTGTLSFDGIELANSTVYDPNIVATIDEPVEPYVPAVSHVLPATGFFTPGFVDDPETNLQTLASLTTAEGRFMELTGLTCTANNGGSLYQTNTNDPLSLVEAMSGLKFTELVVDPISLDFSIGREVSVFEERLRFFVSECERDNNGTMDKMIVYPLAGTTRISTWALELTSANYGPPSPKWNASNTSLDDTVGFYGSIITFALSDFTNGPPMALTGVTGFRLECPSLGAFTRADPSLFGMYELPSGGTVIAVR